MKTGAAVVVFPGGGYQIPGPSNSLFYYMALKDAGVPAELH